jgi:hypothetical protein
MDTVSFLLCLNCVSVKKKEFTNVALSVCSVEPNPVFMLHLQHYSAVMKYISQGPMLLDVHMHRPHTNSRNFMDALLAFWPGLQVKYSLLLVQCVCSNIVIRTGRSGTLVQTDRLNIPLLFI